MRICYVINGLNGGGAALPLPQVLGALRDRGHDVEVVALSRQDGRAEESLRAAGVPCEVLGPERIGPRNFFRLVGHLRRSRPDLIWTSLARATMLGQVAGTLLGIPVVSWHHNVWLKKLNRVLMTRLRHRSFLYVADSEAVKQFAVSELHIPAERIQLWPLFVASRNVPLAEPWTEGAPFRFGSLGRLHHKKGYDRLIRSAKVFEERYPNLASRTEILIAGSGEEQQELASLIATLNVGCVKLVGFTSEPRKFLSTLHAYVQPSRGEGLCIAAHEAMLAGLPVLATPVGQMAYSVTNGVTGLQVDADDAERFASTMACVVQDPGFAARMGQRAREHALTRYSQAQFEERANAVLDQVDRRMMHGQRAVDRPRPA